MSGREHSESETPLSEITRKGHSGKAKFSHTILMALC